MESGSDQEEESSGILKHKRAVTLAQDGAASQDATSQHRGISALNQQLQAQLLLIN